jgi:hypothetical protein
MSGCLYVIKPSPVKIRGMTMFKIFSMVFLFYIMPPNGCVYETLGIAGFVPIRRHKRQCGAERLI